MLTSSLRHTVCSFIVGFCLWASLPSIVAAAQQTASVSGRVTIRGKPVAGIPVFARSADSITAVLRGEVAPSGTTDADGHYRISGLAAKSYYVGPDVPGYVVPSESLISFLPGKSITLREGEEADGLDFSLTRGGVLTGRITYSDGRPVIGGRLVLQSTDSSGRKQVANQWRILSAQMDDRGIYRLYGLAAGKYVIAVDDPRVPPALSLSGGNAPARTYYPGVADENRATVVELKEGAEVGDLDFELASRERARTFTASGRVVDAESGESIPSFDLMIMPTDLSGRSIQMTTSSIRTNSAGEFRANGLSPGSYQVTSSFMAQGETYAEAARFEIAGTDVTGLEVKVHKGSALSGSVVVEGAPDPAVLSKLSQLTLTAISSNASLGAFSSFRQARVAADGSFQFSGLSPGKVRIQMGGLSDLTGMRLSRIERDGVEQPEGIEVVAGENVTGMRVVLSYGTGIIQGQVQIEGGNLPAGAVILISARKAGASQSQSVASAQVDARGRFRVGNLAAGEYELQLRVFSMSDPASVRGLPSVKQNVVVVEGGTAETTLILKLGESQ